MKAKDATFYRLAHVLRLLYFCTLFWDDITIIWKENIVYFFNLEKKTCFGPIRSLFSFSTAQTEKLFWKKLVKQIGEYI